MKLADAGQSYLSDHPGHQDRFYLAPVLAAMGQTTLGRVTVTAVGEYRRGRQTAGIKASSINQEVAALFRIMKHGGHLTPSVRKLRYAAPRRVALSPEQKHRLIQVAATRHDWGNAHAAAVLSVCTTMRGAEIKALQVQDVDLGRRQIIVPRSKTEAGEGRLIMINDDAFSILEPRCRGVLAEAYVIHHEMRPWQPVKSWRRAWASLTRAAGMPGLGFHALRHQAITEMLEAGVPDQVVRSIAGHVSQRMMEHYSHTRVAAKAAAVGALGI